MDSSSRHSIELRRVFLIAVSAGRPGQSLLPTFAADMPLFLLVFSTK
jgi:hypothetical protein